MKGDDEKQSRFRRWMSVMVLMTDEKEDEEEINGGSDNS